LIAREVDFPPVWLAGFAALGGICAWVFPVALPYGRIVGGGLVIVALILMASAVAQLMIARTTVIPGRDPARMVTTGLFCFSRNPIYLADALLLSGLYLYWGALVAMPLVALFMQVLTRRFIVPEEARLRQIFGAEFNAYKSRTRRWI
jgi:protein-S-isoprenylcysteine O-methyltransferase Ste14